MVNACALSLEGAVSFLAWCIAIGIYAGRNVTGFNLQVYEFSVYLFYAVIAAVMGPLYPMAITLIYYDQRMRKEGFDIQKLMEAAGMSEPMRTKDAPVAVEQAPSLWVRVPRWPSE
jgi:hypothetical protein